MFLLRDIRHIVVYRNHNGHSKGLLALVEQVPGRTHSADLSDAFLEQGYWATHGLPFFPVSIILTQPAILVYFYVKKY